MVTERNAYLMFKCRNKVYIFVLNQILGGICIKRISMFTVLAALMWSLGNKEQFVLKQMTSINVL